MKVEYNGTTLMPEEFQHYFDMCWKRMGEHPYESDKINCDIMHLKGEIIKWFADHQVEESK